MSAKCYQCRAAMRKRETEPKPVDLPAESGRYWAKMTNPRWTSQEPEMLSWCAKEQRWWDTEGWFPAEAFRAISNRLVPPTEGT